MLTDQERLTIEQLQKEILTLFTKTYKDFNKDTHKSTLISLTIGLVIASFLHSIDNENITGYMSMMEKNITMLSTMGLFTKLEIGLDH